jgi:hypothetical protein
MAAKPSNAVMIRGIFSIVSVAFFAAGQSAEEMIEWRTQLMGVQVFFVYLPGTRRNASLVTKWWQSTVCSSLASTLQ